MAVLGTRGGWKERSSPACPQTSADAVRVGCKSRSEQGLCGTCMHRIKRKHKPNFFLKPLFFPCRPLPASMMPSDMRLATCGLLRISDAQSTPHALGALMCYIMGLQRRRTNPSADPAAAGETATRTNTVLDPLTQAQ